MTHPEINRGEFLFTTLFWTLTQSAQSNADFCFYQRQHLHLHLRQVQVQVSAFSPALAGGARVCVPN